MIPLFKNKCLRIHTIEDYTTAIALNAHYISSLSGAEVGLILILSLPYTQFYKRTLFFPSFTNTTPLIDTHSNVHDKCHEICVLL